MKINNLEVPKPSKIDPKGVKKKENYNKIAVKTSTSNKDDEKYAPRASRRSFWRPKRPMIEIGPSTRGVIFRALGPHKNVRDLQRHWLSARRILFFLGGSSGRLLEAHFGASGRLLEA